jgi:hypothetical protein
VCVAEDCCAPSLTPLVFASFLIVESLSTTVAAVADEIICIVKCETRQFELSAGPSSHANVSSL